MKVNKNWIDIKTEIHGLIFASALIKKGGDVNNIEDRIAIVESSPRVRVDKNILCIEHHKYSCTVSENDAWLYGDKGSNYYDPISRKWCEDMLKLLGYELV